jgi:hypothetical protein
LGPATRGRSVRTGQQGLVAVDLDAHAARLRLQLGQRGADRGDALEHAALEHAVRELDIKGVLEREHHVDAGMRGHPAVVEVGVVGEGRDVDRQSGVVLDRLADLVVHGLGIGISATTTAAASPCS